MCVFPVRLSYRGTNALVKGNTVDLTQGKGILSSVFSILLVTCEFDSKMPFDSDDCDIIEVIMNSLFVSLYCFTGVLFTVPIL